VPNLRTGTHEIDVSVSGGRLIVRVDGALVSDTAVAVPATALVGFSGATGAATDLHAVHDLRISY
jgi:hypothetical protein